MALIKQMVLFILFPEVGFRREVQKRKVTKFKLFYSIGINFVLPWFFLLIGLFIYTNEPLKKQLQKHELTKVTVFLDDYGRYIPVPFVLFLDKFGLQARSPIAVRVIGLAAAYVVGDFIVYRTKKLSQEARPQDHGLHNSFPSQHTSLAFLAATSLHHQYIGSRGGMAVSAAGMLSASGVGYLRFARDSHWSCDVLVGAAVGMMSVNIIYSFLWGLIELLVVQVWLFLKRIFYKRKMELDL